MKVQFKYTAPIFIKATEVAVIGSFNNYNASLGQMKRNGKEWSVSLDLEPGEYYYKFLINKTIRLNDFAVGTVVALYGQGLWTPLFIEEDTLCVFERNLPPRLGECTFSGSMDMDSPCKDFQLYIDTHVVIRLTFSEIYGSHAITVLWYDPWGKLHSLS